MYAYTKQGRIQNFQIEGAQMIMWTQRTSRGTKREVPYGRGLGALEDYGPNSWRLIIFNQLII